MEQRARGDNSAAARDPANAGGPVTGSGSLPAEIRKTDSVQRVPVDGLPHHGPPPEAESAGRPRRRTEDRGWKSPGNQEAGEKETKVVIA